jgi:multidrug resistance efflux pump
VTASTGADAAASVVDGQSTLAPPVAPTEPSPVSAPPGAESRVPKTSRFHPPRLHIHRPPRRALIPLMLVVIGVVAWLLRPQAPTGPLVASGTLEVEEVTLAAESAGRVADLLVDEGSRVIEGQVVGRLTDPVVDVQSKQSIVDPAQQQLSEAQLSRMQLLAPLSGIVQKRLAHRGEYVGPGTPILTVADPTDLKLTLYVLEPDLARVSLGETVTIAPDGYAGRVFTGVVRTIANRAEFTPRNVQTQRDRQNLVFAITVRVPNPDSALKPGLPVDATFDK